MYHCRFPVNKFHITYNKLLYLQTLLQNYTVGALNRTKNRHMDSQISPECTYAASGSHELLLSGQQSSDQTTTVFYPKRTLKLSNEECCLRKTSSLLSLKEIKDTLHSRLCQRSTASQMVCGLRILPSRPQQEEISPIPVDISNEQVRDDDQPATTEKCRVIKDKKSQPEKELEIGSLEIINSLKAIINGEGVWGKITHSLIRCCADMDQGTDDEEWLDYLSAKIQAIDENPKKYWNYYPRGLRNLIQEIIYSTLKTIRRYSMADVNPEHLDSLNKAIQRVLQKYYQMFGEESFWQILDPDTYTKRTMTHVSQYYTTPWYHYDIIPNTLKKLLVPTEEVLAYLPVLWALKNDFTATETVLGFDAQAIQEMAGRKEQQQQQLLMLFTHRPLDTLLSPVDSMEGFSNFSNTCFAAVSTWQILVSRYIHLLSASSYPQAIECDPGTKEDHNEGYLSLASGEKAIPLKKLSPEVCLALIKKESDRKTKKRLLTAAIRKCLVAMESQYRKKQHSKMQNTYELFLTLCSACASDNIFLGFENFHEKYMDFITSRLLRQKAENKKSGKKEPPEELDQRDELPVFPLKKLPPQDSAEFLAPLLKLVIPKEQLKKCAFRVLTERRVMRGSDILMITDDPRTTPVNTSEVSPVKDTVKPDTLIYSVPVSPEQAERDDFSIQMILDDALSLKNIPEDVHQKITIDCNNFRHAINNLPTSLSRVKEAGTGDLLWDVLQERQVLLVEDVPEVITVQFKTLPEPYDRAKIVEKLAHDVTQEFQLTIRKASPDAILPPEEIIQRYRIVVKVFYVEDREARIRHYRCLINGRERLPENDEQQVIDKVVMDDRRVFIAPQNPEDLYQLGILCMFTAEKTTAATPHMEEPG